MICVVMPSWRMRLLVFTLVFICIHSHRCFAGPIPAWWVRCRNDNFQRHFPDVFAFARRSSPSTPPWNTVFQFGRLNLNHITPPPEFRADVSTKPKHGVNVDTVQSRRSPLPCPAFGGTL